ncbi:flagellar protein FliS [Alteribacillus persepolensis]|uniref:Flagellar protein FliS n=1 Tax=Alteribacillus persepolensis TaxID=568899 RepID=A0A1G8AGI8_9BACI|nr:flagellar export chaperone FliS [Alteribacillus persepolensis]SDH20011.1 flagellar protein FliS [Alteribacillus persepolensis]
MAFQQAQSLYKKNMKQAEAYKNKTTLSKDQAYSPSTAAAARTAQAQTPPAASAAPASSHAYQQNAIQTASRGDLTLLLYNGCLKFIDKADKAMGEQDMEKKNQFIVRAQDIIRELMVTLKTDTELGKNIYQLYDFIHRRLIDANISNDNEALHEARRFVQEFRDTWKETIKLDRQARFKEGDQA